MRSSKMHAPSQPTSGTEDSAKGSNESRLQRFRSFLHNELLADLDSHLNQQDRLDYEAANLQDLLQTIATLDEAASSSSSVKVLADLGCKFFVRASIPSWRLSSAGLSSRFLLVNIGLDVHLEMTPQEAAQFAQSRLDCLSAEREALSTKLGQIQAYASLFAYGLSALAEDE